MKKQRIYLDTSVFGGCFDDEFQVWSNALMKDIETGLFRGVTSEIVKAEIADAPSKVQDQFLRFLDMNPEFLEINEEGIELVEIYLKLGGMKLLKEYVKKSVACYESLFKKKSDYIYKELVDELKMLLENK